MKGTVLRLDKVTKTFFGNNALTEVDFDLQESEIHCICGENGAGKSTLIKLLSGALIPDGGTITVGGESFDALSPHKAHDLGIHVIYQENNLLPNMDIAENIFMGQEKIKYCNIIDKKTLHSEAQKTLDALNVDLDSHETVCNLSIAQQQYVKIARALAYDPKILIFDEPTTMFNITDAERLLKTIVDLKNRGISIIYISHKLAEVLQIADRVTVLRDGFRISCCDINSPNCNIAQITTDMVGHSLDLQYKRERQTPGDTVLEVKNLQIEPDGKKVSFALHKGELLGVAGMVGAGRTEIAEAIFGVRKKYGGSLFVNGKEVITDTPRQAIKNGICLITEDRQKTGVLLEMNINHNITVTALDKLKGFFINRREENRDAAEVIKKVNLKALDYGTDVRYLSGGNQQKVVIGKWLFRDAEIIIFDEPTRGIDVNSKAEIYAIMDDLLREGKSIIMISSDMPELITLSDRIIIIRSGEVTGELAGDRISEENVINLAL